MSVVAFETTPQWANYLDIANDVKPYLQFQPGSSPSDTMLQLILDMACQWVQNYLGRPVAETEFFRRFSGTNVSYISLPYYPVTRMISVVEWWGSSGTRTDNSCTTTSGSSTVLDPAILATDLGSHVNGTNVPGDATITAVTPGVSFTMTLNANATGSTKLVIAQGHVLKEQTPANQGTQDVFQCDYLRGVVIRSFMGLIQRPYFPGSRNVEITWWAGYNPVPAQIRVATLELVNYWWRNTQEAPRTSALQINGYEEPASSALWPAVPQRVTLLLEPFTQQGIG
ncbi:MAG: hypothetical protein NVS3B1_30060 [Marmoricola sp.]